MYTLPEATFAALFRKYRILAGFSTLSKLADVLADQGLLVDVSILSRWQTGDRIPGDRETVLLVLKIFIEAQAIKMSQEANQLLEVAGFGYLTHQELSTLLPNSTISTMLNTFDKINDKDTDILFQAPTIITSLREQGHISLALQVATFFEQHLLRHHEVQHREFLTLFAKIYTVWARTLGDIYFDHTTIENHKKLSYKALKIAQGLNISEIIQDNIQNLAASQYIQGNWTESRDLLSGLLQETSDPLVRAEIVIMLLFDFAHLHERSSFNNFRAQAEDMAELLRDGQSYHADSLIEAISRGLAIMGETTESRQVAEHILFPQIRPFFESQMIKHQLITYRSEARKGKLVDDKHVQELLAKSQQSHMQVFRRHQHQIASLVAEIKTLQPMLHI